AKALPATGGLGHHFGKPEKYPIGDQGVEEIDRAEQPYPAASYAAHERRVSNRGSLSLLGIHRLREPRSFAIAQPLGVGRSIGERAQGKDAKDDGRQSFQE